MAKPKATGPAKCKGKKRRKGNATKGGKIFGNWTKRNKGRKGAK